MSKKKNKNQNQNKTVKEKPKYKNPNAVLNRMIECADKGPSGFWADDYEGCGNPEIFPEFEAGLKHGDYVTLPHTHCMWDTNILYGTKGSVNYSGCYYHCGIAEAKYLTADELRTVLLRFKNRFAKGAYDGDSPVTALLTEDEQTAIKERANKKQVEAQRENRKWLEEQRKKAAALTKKFPGYTSIITFYGVPNAVVSYDGGVVFFDPESQKKVLGAEDLSYDEYIEAQFNSLGKCRASLINHFFGSSYYFKGTIQKITGDKLCFEWLDVNIDHNDGGPFDEYRETHVWMDTDGFHEFKVGDCVKFEAEVYRYIKKNGTQMDYGLRNPSWVTRIDAYEVPTDEDLARQNADRIICSTCLFEDHCNHLSCFRNKDEIERLKAELVKAIKQKKQN